VRAGCGEAHAAPLDPAHAPRQQACEAHVQPRGAKPHRAVPLCPACHRQIHHSLTEKEMEKEYNTTEALLSHPEILRFVSWVKKKPHGVIDRGARR